VALAIAAAQLLGPPGTGAAQTAKPASAPACTSAEYRQFDFWIGEWAVTDRNTGAAAGSSVTERLYDGCVIRENWQSPGFAGGSLNGFRADDGRWHQMWMDQAGAVRHFVGGLDEAGRMVMQAEGPLMSNGQHRLVRMIFTSNADRTVRQLGEHSVDGGQTWKPRYDFIYAPRQ